MADYEFKTVSQVNYGWNLTWESTGKFPIIAKRAFTTFANAQAYVDDTAGTACEGLILAVFNDPDDKKNGIYLVKSVGNGEVSGELVPAGSGTGSITAANYTAAKGLATADNIGQIIYVLNDETSTTELAPDSTEEDPKYVVYTAGPYIVTGAGTVAKLGTTSASGDISGDVETLKGKVGDLESGLDNVEEAISELKVKDIKVGDTSIVSEGVVKLDDAFVTNSQSLNALTHKAIAAKFKSIEESIDLIPKFKVLVVSELPTTDISTSTIYLVTTGEEDKNLYTEYIYIEEEGNNRWEKLGTQKLDLSGYYTSEQVDELLLGYVKVEEGKGLISDEDLAQIETNKTNIETLQNDLGTLTGRVGANEGAITTLQGETIVGVSSGNTSYLTSEANSENSRSLTLTPVIGSFTESKEGLATVNDVKSYVDNAFAWIDITE